MATSPSNSTSSENTSSQNTSSQNTSSADVLPALALRFGRLVRRLRSEAGWSQEEFAFRVGVHRTYVGAIERGEKTVTIETAAKIARALEVTLSQLFVALESEEKVAGT